MAIFEYKLKVETTTYLFVFTENHGPDILHSSIYYNRVIRYCREITPEKNNAPSDSCDPSFLD